ncbi:cupredoxin domain-containing protein [Arthrobacter sp. TMN-50]
MNKAFITRSGAAVAVFLALNVGGLPSAADSGPSQRHIEMQDDCDPATFNAALGEGACVGDGDTTFDELFESLAERNPDGHWRNHPERTHVRKGSDLVISNTGGEFHTFTEVAKFGAGCVPEINDVLGLVGPPAADCGAAFSDPRTALPAGASGTVATHEMSAGIHRFMCMIHPWMNTEVEVRH